MIAYVFWHVRREGVDPGAYDQALLGFHSALAASPPDGFLSSLTFHVQGAAWLGDTGDGYEDWYLVRASSALDRLNDAAVSGQLAAPHEAVARLASWGTAGLYKPVGWDPVDLDAPTTFWFDKPRGITYQAMLSRLEANEPGIDNRLWQRMMTLGPTPEFCLVGRGRDVLPYDWEGQLSVKRRLKA